MRRLTPAISPSTSAVGRGRATVTPSGVICGSAERSALRRRVASAACRQCSVSTGPAKSEARTRRTRSVNSQTGLTMSAFRSVSRVESQSALSVMLQLFATRRRSCR